MLLYQTFKLTDIGLCLQFDVTYSAFYTQQTVYDFAVALMGPPGITAMLDVTAFPGGLNNRQVSRLNNELRGIRVEQMYQPPGSRHRPKVIQRITERSERELEFEGNMGHVSIADYFVKIGEPLKFPYSWKVYACGISKSSVGVTGHLPNNGAYRYPKRLDAERFRHQANN